MSLESSDENNVSILKQALEREGLITWKSRSGFGVSTSWPNEKYKDELHKIKHLFDAFLPKSYAAEGPCFAAGGSIVVYAWPKNDPHYQRHLNEAETSSRVE